MTVRYESSITYHSKVMANVKVCCRQTNRHTDRQGLNKLTKTIWKKKKMPFSPFPTMFSTLPRKNFNF